MLIPGLPPAGAQQEVFRPDRQPRTSAAEGPAQDPLADLPVQQDSAFAGDQRGGQSGERASDEGDSDRTATPADPDAAAPDLPRKGLLVDIRA